jgi:RNA polymerase sigma-32 factor
MPNIMSRPAAADLIVTAESGLTCYLWEIRWFSMMEPHEGEKYVLAKRRRARHEAAHKLVNSHLRLAAKDSQGLLPTGVLIEPSRR